jgi:hypothetical protein
MVETLGTIILLTAAWPLWRAWWANRHTSLLHTVNWTIVAWGAWVLAFVACLAGTVDPVRLTYVAVSMTGCASVAGLGARRPGLGAWNFVVIGLLAVTLLPLAEALVVAGRFRVEWYRQFFVGAIIAVGILNYLPTRLWLAAVLLAVGVGAEVASLSWQDYGGQASHLGRALGRLALALAPWAGLLGMRNKGKEESEFDRFWLAFRDRFGLVWGQRVREQFNRSAANARWPVVLYWRGLRRLPASQEATAVDPEELIATLKALLKRFIRVEGPHTPPARRDLIS